MNQNENELLGQMPVPKAIAKIGIPAIASMLVMAVYNLVDTLFIGMLGDDLALSAVAVAFPIMTLMSAIGQVFGAGSAAAIGRAFGASEEEYPNRVATTIIYTSLVSGLIFMGLGLLFMEPIFRLFGTTDAVMPSAVEYGGWMFVGAVFSIPNQTFNNIARAEAKATLSMRSLFVGAGLNIILDPIFMFDLGGFGLNMGIEGASIATTLAQAFSFLYISRYFFFGKTRVKVLPAHFSPTRAIYADVFRSGAPVGVTQMLSTLAVSFTNICALSFAPTETIGQDIQSAYGIVLKIILMLQFVVMGFLMGYQPLASFSFGSKNKTRFYEAFRFSRNVLLLLTVPATVILLVFAPQIMMAFTQTQSIIDFGALFLRFNGATYVFVGMSTFFLLTFQATGNGAYGSFIALARQGVLYLPLLFGLCAAFGVTAMFYAQPVADVLTMAIATLLFRKYSRTLNQHFG